MPSRSRDALGAARWIGDTVPPCALQDVLAGLIARSASGHASERGALVELLRECSRAGLVMPWHVCAAFVRTLGQPGVSPDRVCDMASRYTGTRTLPDTPCRLAIVTAFRLPLVHLLCALRRNDVPWSIVHLISLFCWLCDA